MGKLKLYKKKKKSLTDAETVEAMSLYCEKVKEDIFSMVHKDLNIVINDKEMKNLISIFMDYAITKGVELGSNKNILIDFYLNLKEEKEPKITDYEFKPYHGVSGALLPDGTFMKCGNAEHYLIMKNIPSDVQHKTIYFTSFVDGVLLDGNISYSPIQFKKATPQQKEWMEQNKIYFDEGQLRSYLLMKNKGLI